MTYLQLFSERLKFIKEDYKLAAHGCEAQLAAEVYMLSVARQQKSWTGLSLTELIRKVEDRHQWRKIVHEDG